MPAPKGTSAKKDAPKTTSSPKPSPTSNHDNKQDNNYSGGSTSGGNVLNASGKCGSSHAVAKTTKTSGPNGSIQFLNCGIDGGGWNPPYINIKDVVVKSLSESIDSGHSPFKACSKYVKYFNKYGDQFGIPPIFLASFAMQESSCQPETVGGAGEQGLMQITKDKCGGAPGGNCRDPDFNIRTGAKYFASTLDDVGGDVLLAVGRYNGWYPGLTASKAKAAKDKGCCRCQQNLDYVSSPALTASSPPSSIPSPQMQNLTLADLPPVSDEDKAEATRIKAQANKAFTSHDFPTAAKLYSEAIGKNPNEPTLWCNRAYARMKLEEFGYALTDATHAIQLDPRYAKAYYRRATCYLQTLRPQLAVSDFKKVLALEPNNETVRQQMVSTQKLIRKIEFEKAIEMEEEKDAVTRCLEIIQEGDIVISGAAKLILTHGAQGGCDLDKNYEGPSLSLEDGKYGITLEFVRKMIQWFKDGKTLPKRYVWEIALGAHRAFAAEESLVEVSVEDGVTVDVIGDVHGQFYDMLHLFSLTGEPSEKHYLLMNGDLVDRGSWSMEVILVAFAFKWLYPKYMFINRGNHEAKEMNRTYGFEGEAKTKHGEQSYKLFAHIFTTPAHVRTVPLATLLSATKPPTAKEGAGAILSADGFKRYFVVHGGLFSKDEVTLDDIRRIPRLLWTDPQEESGRGPSKRGVGIAFGPDVTKRWCTLNKVSGIIRSHEVRQDGYQIEHDGLCTTVFSAPNYVDQAGNKGAFIRIDSAGSREYFQFMAKPHPPMKPMAYVQGGLGNLMMM
ncbi:hypothetical protein D9756_007546 [Leucocoprinus leucothites]|uniref:Serine/threonine-protein phosphatase n=1 Tax=Leucocoprinus leucothites TaxID=201217 RepID=A0A8H5FWU5_9AGAR|nr:hypothetical protein D9756_007546 [Leucoagaricus leucothites]